jgi:hypothetical protein
MLLLRHAERSNTVTPHAAWAPTSEPPGSSDSPTATTPQWSRLWFWPRSGGRRDSHVSLPEAVWPTVLLLLVYAAAVSVRMPQILLKGRFWAEEGAIYFLNGRNLSWYDALIAVHTGYLNLAASIGTLLAARLVPIEAAPWVSTGFAMLIQLCPPLLLLTSRASWLRSGRAKAAALLLLLSATPSAEVWLNTITSQFHLAVATALILALPLRDGPTRWFQSGLLVLAPFSGPTSSVLAPLFILRAYVDRSRQRLEQGALLGCVGAVQLVMILLHPEPSREIGITPRLLALVIYVKQLLLPLLGTVRTETLTHDLIRDMLAGRSLWMPLLLSATWMTAIVLAAWQSRVSEARWLVAAGAVLMAASYFGALGQHIDLLLATFGDRYSYAPMALFNLALLAVALGARGWLQGAAAVVLCVILWTGMHEYFSPPRMMQDGSSWWEEIARWHADPAYRVQFWPTSDVWRWPIASLTGPRGH